MNYPIADFLNRIRNAGLARNPEFSIQYSKIKESIADLLYRQGYVSSYTISNQKLKTITIKLKYVERRHVISGIRLISKPSIRHYVESTKIPKVLSGMGIAILTTSKGIMTGAEAAKNNVGGELICYIW